MLFEAVCTANQSLGDRGMAMVAAVVVAASAAVAAVFLALGAWPVIGFTGLEVLLVLGLLSLHRRRGRRALEVLALVGDRLVVRRTDARGRLEEMTFDPYWARVSLEERPGTAGRLLLTERRRRLEVGELLGEEERRQLAAMLAEALRRYREPVFDNPQLRD
ncbi:MAG: DUF2244 domain-containing protein [Acetobacteraceae bacterium]|nr:DUF2244 domain-containing protein [Acetobacteraceae bacterium]